METTPTDQPKPVDPAALAAIAEAQARVAPLYERLDSRARRQSPAAAYLGELTTRLHSDVVVEPPTNNEPLPQTTE